MSKFLKEQTTNRHTETDIKDIPLLLCSLKLRK